MQGLTSEEVKQRKEQGLVNNGDVRTSRTYTDIFVKNTFTPFNIVLFIIGAMLLFCHEVISALSATGIIIVNILIATVQEMRAKRRLDKISLLTRPKVTVIRDGMEVEIDQKEIVKDDLIILRSGEQALVDGEILECRSLEMDESLLTGESSTVRKNVGESVYSGSFCITGEGVYRVTAFGDDSYASQMLLSAKKFTSKKTPLQMETGSITKVLMITSAILMGITAVMVILGHGDLFSAETLEILVLCLDVVPIALFLLITLTYMIAAVRMADSGVLLQRSNSVESISHVDTVCMDKTGTITTNKLVFQDSHHLIDPGEAEHLASVFATATGSKNRTIGTIITEYGESDSELIDEIQFSSQRKFSAVKVRDAGNVVTMYTGAWSILREHCKDVENIDEIVRTESLKGFRTVVICKTGDVPLYSDGEPTIPELDPFTVISIRDEVRHDCRETIEVFLENDMDLKVISGDDPVTVDALFSIANIPGERKIISGPELDSMDPEMREKTILETNIFGRMKPENKEEVIEVLKRNDRYVAMIGDGVNDVKSLKSAQVGISLESGSNAARGVSDMILVNDNFSALPKALVEGRKTVSGMRDILKLYLTRNFALAIMFLFTFVFVGSIPMIPIQNTYYAFVSVSIMAFFMTFFSKPEKNKDLILPDVLRFSIPSAIIIATFGLITYAATWLAYENGVLVIDWEYLAGLVPSIASNGEELIHYLSWSDSGAAEVCARSAMVFFVTTAGILQILLICPRFKFLSPNGRINKSPLPIALVLFLFLVIYTMYTYFPIIAIGLVGLVIFPKSVFAILLIVVALWFVVELALLKKGAFKKTVEKIEEAYMESLHEEYNKGSVRDE